MGFGSPKVSVTARKSQYTVSATIDNNISKLACVCDTQTFFKKKKQNSEMDWPVECAFHEERPTPFPEGSNGREMNHCSLRGRVGQYGV